MAKRSRQGDAAERIARTFIVKRQNGPTVSDALHWVEVGGMAAIHRGRGRFADEHASDIAKKLQGRLAEKVRRAIRAAIAADRKKRKTQPKRTPRVVRGRRTKR